MSDLIDRRKAFDGLKYEMKYTAYDIIENIPSAEPERKWIPITLRESTEEERKVHPDWDFGFACQLPCDEEIVLLTDGTYVWEDTFHCDDGCYFERADDIEDWEGYAWMPMPKPYKGK